MIDIFTPDDVEAAKFTSPEDVIEREIAAGLVFGPWHRQWQMRRAPEKVMRYLEKARESKIRADVQAFRSMSPRLGNPSDFNARNTSASELNILGIDINGTTPQAQIDKFCRISPNDAYAGKIYEVNAFGVYGNTGTPTLIATPRWGNSPTVATNITLGASATLTTITGTTALPYEIRFRFGIRTGGVQATDGTGKGRGWVILGIPATSTQLTLHLAIGGTAATIDTSGAGAAGCGITMNFTWGTSSASNTSTCEHYALEALN